MVTAIRHVPFEDLGSFEDVFVERGMRVQYFDAPTDRWDDLPSDAELVVVLGGPIGAYDDEQFPFLRRELTFVATRISEGRPTLGICLGAQLIARALGARVYPGAVKEIGWSTVRLSDAGRRSVLSYIEDTPVLHWHGDTFDLPEGARLLASTDLYQNQAFAFGSSVLALQFHPEVSADSLERWYVGHYVELSGVPNLSLATLRKDAVQYGPNLRTRSAKSLRAWLDGLAL